MWHCSTTHPMRLTPSNAKPVHHTPGVFNHVLSCNVMHRCLIRSLFASGVWSSLIDAASRGKSNRKRNGRNRNKRVTLGIHRSDVIRRPCDLGRVQQVQFDWLTRRTIRHQSRCTCGSKAPLHCLACEWTGGSILMALYSMAAIASATCWQRKQKQSVS